MTQFGGGRVHADPKTDSQLRAALHAAQAGVDEVIADLDTLETQVGPVSAVFGVAGAVGQAVYASGSGTVSLANAGATATSGVVGLVSTAASLGGTGAYITAGLITVADWTAVIGSASLTAGSLYFLDTTNGLLTVTAPTTVGQTVVEVGRALTTTTFLVAIKLRVLL